MEITSHNIMNGLRKWIMEDDWNTIRLHLSHNDLDGYGCHVMTRLATNILNPNSKSSITFWSTTAGKENIEDTIIRFITKMETLPKDPKKQYIKGKKKIFILITDLGSFNPNFINSLIADGHIINYLYIDHHQIPANNNKVELEGNTEEFQMVRNCFYVDDSMCATLSLSNAVRAIISQKRPPSLMTVSGTQNTKIMLDHIKSFSEKVNKFDLGLWGEWVGLTSGKIDDSVAINLFFQSYLPNERYKYVSLMANYFHTFAIGHDIPKEEKPFWCIDMTRFKAHYFNAVGNQLKGLNAEFEKCKKLLRPLTITFNIPDSIPDKDNLKIYEIYTDENDVIHSFTLISRELLNANSDIDIIALVYNRRQTVDMRTARDDLNLFEIAYANGGGGHPKAAGFPMNKKEV